MVTGAKETDFRFSHSAILPEIDVQKIRHKIRFVSLITTWKIRSCVVNAEDQGLLFIVTNKRQQPSSSSLY